jgi:hypothetical protein
MNHHFTREQIMTIFTYYLLSSSLGQLEQWMNDSHESTFRLRLLGPAFGQRSAEMELMVDISEALPIIRRMKSHPFSRIERRGNSVQNHKLLRRYFSDEPIGVISVTKGAAPKAPAVHPKNADDTGPRYWLAVNGDSAAVSPYPLSRVQCSPRPQLLLGFKTRDKAFELQSFILNAPLKDVQERLMALARDPEVVSIVPRNPEPPTRGATIWTAD